MPLSRRHSYSDSFLLTIHGIVSENEGLAKVRTACEKALPGLRCDSFFYGKKFPVRDIDKARSQTIFQHVREKLDLVYRKHITHDDSRLFIVAHSFGTLAVMRALELHIPGVRIEGLVLLGSAVPRDYFWDGFIESGVLRHPPLAVVRPLDRTIRFARRVDGDDSGAKGFISNGMYKPT